MKLDSWLRLEYHMLSVIKVHFLIYKLNLYALLWNMLMEEIYKIRSSIDLINKEKVLMKLIFGRLRISY